MGTVKEASWSIQSGVMECGYHDRQGNDNCRCPTQEESRHSVCTGGKMESIESEECGPWLQTVLSWRHEQLACPNTKEVTTIISVYAPQQGLSELEKDQFYEQLETATRQAETVIIGGE